MDADFFVMLNTQRGGITPLVEENGELAVFPDEDAARDAANRNTLGGHFGFEIFQRGFGCA